MLHPDNAARTNDYHYRIDGIHLEVLPEWVLIAWDELKARAREQYPDYSQRHKFCAMSRSIRFMDFEISKLSIGL